MTKNDVGKKPASNTAPAARKSDAELKESELEQISGGVALVKPANPRRKNPNKVISDPPPPS
ncbi:MAG TPA: hypothetical protein VL899_07410 [Alphaproteobacteria bacterium]|nr:hypothetical protein [Alphaproteobacteria bacterium]